MTAEAGHDFEHLGGGAALWEAEVGLDDERTTQRDGEEHTEEAAEQCAQHGLPVLDRVPVADQVEPGQGVDHSGGDRAAGRAARLHGVHLQRLRVAQCAQHRQRENRRRDRHTDGHAGEQSQVGVRCTQHRREEHHQHKAAHCEFGQLARCVCLEAVAATVVLIEARVASTRSSLTDSHPEAVLSASSKALAVQLGFTVEHLARVVGLFGRTYSLEVLRAQWTGRYNAFLL
mmetsp:Transcript_22756/g.57070  ORF Transcript_22756/g.57070 Transcript_22756/m.57070 type:complete len:231 (-) Transcript_22756:301-993(-)